MIVDGFTTDVQLDGEFGQAVQWKAFALDKLRQMIRSGYRGLRVMRMGEVQLRVWLDPASKQAKVWVAAGGLQHGIMFAPGYYGGALAPYSFGPPFTDSDGEPVNGGLGTALRFSVPKQHRLVDAQYSRGESAEFVEYALTNAYAAIKETTGVKYGNTDWVHVDPETGAFLGYLTWSSRNTTRSVSLVDWGAGTRYRTRGIFYNGKAVIHDTAELPEKTRTSLANRSILGAAIQRKATSSAEKPVDYVFFVVLSTSLESKFEVYRVPLNGPASETALIGTYTLENAFTRVSEWFYDAGWKSNTRLYDYSAVLFAFNQSGTRASAVLYRLSEKDRGVDPNTFVGEFDYFGEDREGWYRAARVPVVLHADVTESSATFTLEPEIAGTTVSVGESVGATNGSVQDDFFASVTGSTSTQSSSPAATVAIDYVGDDEVRMLRTFTTETNTSSNSAGGFDGAESSEGSTSTSISYTFTGPVPASAVMPDGTAQTSSSETYAYAGEAWSGSSESSTAYIFTYPLYVDLRYGTVIALAHTYTSNITTTGTGFGTSDGMGGGTSADTFRQEVLLNGESITGIPAITASRSQAIGPPSPPNLAWLSAFDNPSWANSVTSSSTATVDFYQMGCQVWPSFYESVYAMAGSVTDVSDSAPIAGVLDPTRSNTLSHFRLYDYDTTALPLIKRKSQPYDVTQLTNCDDLTTLFKEPEQVPTPEFLTVQFAGLGLI